MSHAVVNVDVSENSPTVRKSPFSQSVGVWVDMDVSLHFRDAGHLGEWLAAACEGLSALLDPAPRGSKDDEPLWQPCPCGGTGWGGAEDIPAAGGPTCSACGGLLYAISSASDPPAVVNPCSGSDMPDRQGEVEG